MTGQEDAATASDPEIERVAELLRGIKRANPEHEATITAALNIFWRHEADLLAAQAEGAAAGAMEMREACRDYAAMQGFERVALRIRTLPVPAQPALDGMAITLQPLTQEQIDYLRSLSAHVVGPGDPRKQTLIGAPALAAADARVRDAALDEAAEVADEHGAAWGKSMASPAVVIATAIRARKGVEVALSAAPTPAEDAADA